MPCNDSSTPRWEGVNDGEAWVVEVDTDLFSEREGFVVVIDATHEDEDSLAQTLIAPSAEQAREIAAALLVAADRVDANNARIAALPGEDRGATA